MDNGPDTWLEKPPLSYLDLERLLRKSPTMWVTGSPTESPCFIAFRRTTKDRQVLVGSPFVPLRRGWGGRGRHDPRRVDGEIGSQAGNCPNSQSLSQFFSRKMFKLLLFYLCIQNGRLILTTEDPRFALVITIIVSGFWQDFSLQP